MDVLIILFLDAPYTCSQNVSYGYHPQKVIPRVSELSIRLQKKVKFDDKFPYLEDPECSLMYATNSNHLLSSGCTTFRVLNGKWATSRICWSFGNEWTTDRSNLSAAASRAVHKSREHLLLLGSPAVYKLASACTWGALRTIMVPTPSSGVRTSPKVVQRGSCSDGCKEVH